ncbi:hypothetical protein ABZS77_29235 [Micromonospora sp. NPDC005298]|uniref:hypothetical protein n=1 Tax=Micromonospora sp. NPDC005298 TaxID=3156873 RepID=UPI0033B3C64F
MPTTTEPTVMPLTACLVELGGLRLSARRSERGKRRAEKAAVHRARTRAELETARSERERAEGELGKAEHEVSAAAGRAVETAAVAGLGDQVPVWATSGDVDRFDAAITARRAQVGTLRKLIRAASKAAAVWEALDDSAQKAKEQLDERTEAAKATEHAFGACAAGPVRRSGAVGDSARRHAAKW